MQLTEHRSRAQGLADLLLYDSLIDDGVMLLQDGALMAAWTFRGPDMASATNGEMAALSARLNSVLKLGTGWMIQCDAIRSRAPATWSSTTEGRVCNAANVASVFNFKERKGDGKGYEAGK